MASSAVNDHGDLFAAVVLTAVPIDHSLLSLRNNNNNNNTSTNNALLAGILNEDVRFTLIPDFTMVANGDISLKKPGDDVASNVRDIDAASARKIAKAAIMSAGGCLWWGESHLARSTRLDAFLSAADDLFLLKDVGAIKQVKKLV